MPTVALALGGGGARGIAHILMLEVFDELGIKPVMIAGTSIGALYGAAYASGLTASQIRAYTEEVLERRFDLIRQLFAARSAPVQRLLRVLPLRSSVLNPETLLDLLFPGRVAKDFADLDIPLQVVATDLSSHEATVLASGPLRPAVAASIAIPVLFTPVTIGGRMLVDGGLANPLPFDLIDGAADITVAIDVNAKTAAADIGPRLTVVDVVVQSIQILQKSVTRERLRYRRPDILIEVAVDRFGALEFTRPHEILEAAQPAKLELRRALEHALGTEHGGHAVALREDSPLPVVSRAARR
ncbi:MAG: patatin-like phospholipase family protein [Hyphomicrobiaceae bacterium]|nr:patatin-like phospholipase family protein [Hyphomicrobiaceae bacterium]